jgi:hypothetical protein
MRVRPTDVDFAAVGLQGAGQDLHQGRLSGPILADERVYLALAACEVHIAECADAAKRLVDALHLQD